MTRRHRAGSDAGAAGLLVVGGGVLAVGATVVAGVLVSGAHAHTRAQSAADMVALGVGAQLLVRPDPCTIGPGLAARNDVVLRSCEIVDGGVTVTIAQALPSALSAFTGHDDAIARARAELEFGPPADPSVGG